ncbi:hypothetical protein AB3Z07_24715 [Metabacillus halosaccharovorans]|uniref:hypothetical protein n=1 Tax=Bacillaceae TaxID=186817 RepID=UPI0012EB932C|nr:hypothetical protein [Bacillus sp. J37]
MKKFLKVNTCMWKDPIISEEMSKEERMFYVYLLMNQGRFTNEDGTYQISKKQIAVELEYSLELVDGLMKRFVEQLKLIKYNQETGELIIGDTGKAFVRVVRC